MKHLNDATHRKQGLTSLQSRLILLIGLTTLLLVGLGFWTFQRYEAINHAERQSRSGDEAYAAVAQKLRQSWAERQSLLTELRAQTAPEQVSQLTFRIEGLTRLADEQLAQLVQLSQSLKNQPLREIEREIEYHANVFRAAQVNYTAQAAQPNLIEGLPDRSALDQTMASVLAPEYVATIQLLEQHQQKRTALGGGSSAPELIATTQYYTLVAFLIVVLLLVAMPLLFFGRPIAFLRRIISALDRLKFGDISQEKLPEPDDEVGAIAQGINTVSDNLNKAAAFANAIGQGRFDSEFEIAGSGDVLGEALVEMRDRLRDVADDEARRNWAIAGFARFGEILRANNDLETFTDEIIRNLTQYIRAIQGGFFLVEEQADGKPVLRLVNSYAYERRKYMEKSFRLGEGLVGQAAMEKGTILVTEVPQNYVTVTSGLGQANPSCLLVVPLVSNGELYGALEFAAFHRFESHVVEFVERLAENIAGTLTNVRNNERTLRLLDETQQMANKLKVSELETRQHMEELSSTSAEMKRVQIELDGQIKAINYAAIVSETNLAGDIIFANDEFCRISQYSREELLGQNHRILKSGHQPDEIFVELWQTISAGKVWKGLVKNKKKNEGYYWVNATITPVLGADGKPVKYIGVRFDVSEQVAQEEKTRDLLRQSQIKELELRAAAEENDAAQTEMRRITAEMQGQIGALNNSAIVSEANIAGDIIFVNEEFLRISKYSREELIGVNHRILKSGHQPDALFDDLWATISAGKVWKGTVKNRAKDGTYYWVATTVTPVKGTDGKPFKYVGVRFDISEQITQEERVRQALEESQAQEEELRQNAEEMAATQEEIQRMAVELEGQIGALNNAAIVSEADLRGDIIFVNDEFVRISKYSREELLGINHRILKSGHQPDEIFEDLWMNISAGRVWKGVIKNRAKDGSYYWVSTTITPVLDRERKPVKYVGVRFDISEQIAQEARVRQALEESQAQEEEIRQNAEEMAATQEELQRMNLEFDNQLRAIDRSTAVIEFDMHGNILEANENFLRIFGYKLEEVKGRHHRMFATESDAASQDYADFWAGLREGRFESGNFRRVGRDGRAIWLQGSYNPILGLDGKPYKVIKFATDITETILKEEQVRQMLEESQAQEEEIRQNAEEMAATQEEMKRVNLEFDNQLRAIDRSTAVIEFDLNGNILEANENFLRIFGYKIEEVKGRHHRIFATEADAASDEYQDFWARLRDGQFESGNFRRVGKDGRTIWLQGSYNPILGLDGKPYKVIKFATDITETILKEEQVRQMLEETQAQEEEIRQNAEEMAATQEELQRMNLEFDNQLRAIDRSTAVIEFDLNGNILEANENFLRIFGYKIEEVKGRHHRIFATEADAASDEYQDFWARLRDGRFESGNFRRVGKDGRTIWLQGSYNPILGLDGKPYKVIKFATDITETILKEEQVRQMLEETQAQEEEIRQNAEEMAATQEELQRMNLEFDNQLRAIDRSTAVIEFDMNGNILEANENFLRIFGYRIDEVKGRHHRMFATEADAASGEYQDFWARLRDGQFESGNFRRVGKDGRTIWLQGSYNPILGLDGKPYKVIKFATDITETILKEEQVRQMLEETQAQEEEIRQNAEEMAATQEELQRMNLEFDNQLRAIDRSSAVIEFDLNGNILEANDNFLRIFGYRIDEVKGRHHRMFATEADAASQDYQDFWARLRNGRFESGNFRRVGKGGRAIWLQGSYNPILGLDGKSYKVIKFATDITETILKEEQVRQALEQTQAQEEELRQNAEEMAATQEQMRRLNRDMEATLRAINRTSAVFELDAQGCFVRANDNFLRSAGYASEQLIGQPYALLVSAEEAQSIEFRRFWNRLLEGIPEKGEFALKRRDGSQFWIIGTYNPLVDENERTTRILVIASDVTLEKEQEEILKQTMLQLKERAGNGSPELQAELERARVEFETARRELTQQLDAAKRLTAFLELNAKGFITSVNDRLLEIMGYESYEVIGLHVDDLLDAADSVRLKELLGNGHQPVEEARLKLKSKAGDLTQWSGWYQFSKDDLGALNRVRLFLNLYQ